MMLHDVAIAERLQISDGAFARLPMVVQETLRHWWATEHPNTKAASASYKCDHELGCTRCGMLACELDTARPVGLRQGGSMTFHRGECLFVDMHGQTWEVRETFDRFIPLEMSLRSV